MRDDKVVKVVALLDKAATAYINKRLAGNTPDRYRQGQP
jgi:hypothetical protein